MVEQLLLLIFLAVGIYFSIRLYHEKDQECADYITEISKIRYEYACLFEQYKIICEKYIKIRSHNIINDNIIEAVKYAVKKSHPDNGGNTEDFIKFKKCLDTLEENQANRN